MTWHRRLIKKEQGDPPWVWDTAQDISPNIKKNQEKVTLFAFNLTAFNPEPRPEGESGQMF